MNKKSSSGSGMFLMEMIVVVFFFILCASTCIMVFVQSNSRSMLASETNRSVIEAESIAETIKGGRWEEFFLSVNGNILEDGSCQINWDDNWLPIDTERGLSYQALVTFQMQEQLQTADIVITRLRDQKELYRLQVKKYGTKQN